MTTQKEEPTIIYIRVYQTSPYGIVRDRELIVKIEKPQDSHEEIYDFLLKEVKSLRNAEVLKDENQK